MNTKKIRKRKKPTGLGGIDIHSSEVLIPRKWMIANFRIILSFICFDLPITVRICGGRPKGVLSHIYCNMYLFSLSVSYLSFGGGGGGGGIILSKVRTNGTCSSNVSKEIKILLNKEFSPVIGKSP